MAEQQQVTVREIAEIVLGSAQSEPAMIQELTNAGIKIGEDWAGRPAVAQADARKYVGDIVSRRRKSEADYLAGRALAAEVANAQLARDRLYESEYMARYRSNTPKERALKEARAAVLAAEKDLPREVRKRLGWKHLSDLVPYVS